MHIRREPRLIAGFFIGGTTLLIGGAAVAASLSPSSARMLHMSAARQAQASSTIASGHQSATSATSAPEATSTTVSAKPHAKPVATRASTSTSAKSTTKSTTRRTTAVKAPITYTVRRGDTLTGIAAWFKLHGYGDLYAANAKVIGANPNLIEPGERITIGTHVMTVRGPA